MIDHSVMKLGCLPPHPPELSKRVFLTSVFGTELPNAPAERDWLCGETQRPMFGNNTVGDCTCAGMANMFADALKATYGLDWTPTTREVLGLYSEVTQPPYNPVTGANDRGAVIEDVIIFVQKNGFMGHHLIGSVAVDPKNVENIKRCIDWFGNVDIGLALPLAWQRAETWNLGLSIYGDWAPGSWGGHCVVSAKYDENGVYVWTWGKLVLLTWGALANYGMSVDGVICAAWVKAGKCPPGLSLSILEQRIKEIAA